jgi:heme iron utilization protein
MGWVEAGDYGAAQSDPLAEIAEGIMEHMNADHADALLAYARFFAKEEADEARMVAVDRLGFKLHLKDGERRWSTRVAFPREVTTAADSRTVLIEMARLARAE